MLPITSARIAMNTTTFVKRPAGAYRVLWHRNASTEVTPVQTEHPPKSVESVSGAPGMQESLGMDRAVRIYPPSKGLTQQGENNTRCWRIDFDPMGEGDQWENPLIGWASSADSVQGLEMTFDTKEAAIHFADRQGWAYYVDEKKKKKFVKKSYDDNYKYEPGKLRLVFTK